MLLTKANTNSHYHLVLNVHQKKTTNPDLKGYDIFPVLYFIIFQDSDVIFWATEISSGLTESITPDPNTFFCFIKSLCVYIRQETGPNSLLYFPSITLM